MNNSVKEIYRQSRRKGVWLRMSKSQTFKRGVYNYNVVALYMDDSDSIVPIGKQIYLGQSR